MKTNFHPTYHSKATVTCVCGAIFVAGSTLESFSTEVCSACHPFYTGKQKLVDTAGKVDKFRAKMAKADSKVEKKSKISESIRAAAATKSKQAGSALSSAKAVAKIKKARELEELKSTKAKEVKEETAAEAPAEQAA